MKLAGCFNSTKTSHKPKDQGKFEFSSHYLFNSNPCIKEISYTDFITDQVSHVDSLC